MLREKIHSVLTTAALNEFVLLELLSSGRYRKHIDRLQQKLGTARNAASRELRQAGILLERPAEGGLFLWGALPSGIDVDVLVKDAYRHAILLAGSAAFAADGASDPHLRFNVVFSQHARLCTYLRDRLGAWSLAHSALARAATKAPTLR